jgi:broad specificity phosphatase PhoE
VPGQIVLVRHGETEWSRDGRHTGLTDLPLTDKGELDAHLVGPALRGWDFVHRFVSPLQRAKRTAELSGVPGQFVVEGDLVEWDYGVYEGRRTVDIQQDEPGWNKWFMDLPEGETVGQVAERADRAIVKVVEASEDGDVVVFAHGHLLAVMIARWVGLEPADGRRIVLETATYSVLDTKRGDRVLVKLNNSC